MNIFGLLVHDTRGATVIEYALIATLISIVAVALITSIGTSVSGMFGSVASDL